jgi:hypothetical protein
LTLEVIQDPDGNKLYPTEAVEPLAEELVYQLKECFSATEICGFIRRQEKHTYDIGIVSIPNENIFNFSTILANCGLKISGLEMKERKALFYVTTPEGWKVHCDWHMMENEVQFEVMKLIRTGSYQFIMDLEMQAKDRNLFLRHGGRMTLGSLNGAMEYVLWGLYGGATSWNNSMQRYESVVNPLYRAAWKERDIIEKVMDDYVEPPDRI